MNKEKLKNRKKNKRLLLILRKKLINRPKSKQNKREQKNKKKRKFKSWESFKKKHLIGRQNLMLWEPKERWKQTKEQPDKKIELRLKSGPKKLNSFKKQGLNNKLKRKEDSSNKPKHRKPNFRQQWENRDSSRKWRTDLKKKGSKCF